MRGKQSQGTEHKDPVCGMTVDEGTGVKDTYKGKDYFFCSQGCQRKFQDDPETYTGKKEEAHRA